MGETALKIRLFGEPVLRKKTRSVKQITQAHRDILSEMARLMYELGGIGLAASQVGIDESMIVVDTDTGLCKLINPKVVRRQGSQVREEGCLSIPGVCIKVRRAKKVLVEGRDENARAVKIEAEDLLACVLQHEIEHLEGKLIIDHASLFEKLRLRKRLEGLKKKVKDERLSESETKSCQLQL